MVSVFDSHLFLSARLTMLFIAVNIRALPGAVKEPKKELLVAPLHARLYVTVHCCLRSNAVLTKQVR